MDEQSIPIDINNSKLLEWLVSRRHVKKDWQDSILKIRQKINNALQDMPAHEEIMKLLSGQHINYYHCLNIVKILKETEAGSMNLLGRYRSQRMKDWQDIVSLYQKENVYLAEAAQILIRNVSYEIPSLKKQVIKLDQLQTEAQKKIKDYGKHEAVARKEFAALCEQLGIAGRNIKEELLKLVNELPEIYTEATNKIKEIKPAIDLYKEFNKFLFGKNLEVEVLSLLSFIVEHGNVATYHYTYGEAPHIIEPVKIELEDQIDNEIDFGDDRPIDFGDISSNNFDIEVKPNIEWNSTPSTDEDFEIVSHTDIEISLEESGIVVEKAGVDEGVARGVEALTLLDNSVTRDQIIDELMELEAFVKMRLFELSSDTDILAMSQMQNASTVLQMQTVESITSLNDSINIALSALVNKRSLHLYNIKHSPKYIDILTSNLKQKLFLAERIKQNRGLLEEQVKQYRNETRAIEPLIKVIIASSKELQQEVQADISKKYKGRIVNIVGGVNML